MIYFSCAELKAQQKVTGQEIENVAKPSFVSLSQYLQVSIFSTYEV